jgi:hypothetical protein
MLDSLASGHAIVNPDVVTIGAKLFIEASLSFVEQCKNRIALIARQIKIRTQVPARDDEGMAIRYWKPVPHDDTMLVGKYDARW